MGGRQSYEERKLKVEFEKEKTKQKQIEADLAKEKAKIKQKEIELQLEKEKTKQKEAELEAIKFIWVKDINDVPEEKRPKVTKFLASLKAKVGIQST